MTTRKIKRIVRGATTRDGAGVKLTRVIGNGDVYDFDPFLMLDVFDSTNPDDYTMGFPSHPHRGIETVTYLIEGEIEHGDNLGNGGIIRSGDCQWMTAGSGIIHSEMPKASPRLFGLQFWINLQRSEKMSPPKYHGVTAKQIPNVEVKGGTIRVISGSFAGVPGAMKNEHVKVTFLDVELDAMAKWKLATPYDMTVYLYILSGSGKFTNDEEIVIEKNAILFTEGDEVVVRAGGNGLRFVLCMAMPIRERIAWGGPIVMNTERELEQAFVELQSGTFIKENAPA